MSEYFWQIVLAIFGFLITAVGTLIVWYLQSIKDEMRKVSARQDQQDEKIIEQNKKIDSLEKVQLVCRQNCQQDFVSAEQFVRNESYTRKKLDDISNQVSQLAGSLKIVEQMPAILGQIATNIVKEMKG